MVALGALALRRAIIFGWFNEMPHKIERRVFFIFVIRLMFSSVITTQTAPSTISAEPPPGAPPSQVGLLTKFAEQVEPGRDGRTDRLPQYVEFFRAKLANDTRLFAFHVNPIALESGKIELHGYVEFSQMRDGLVRFMQELGFDVVDKLDVLPDQSLGPDRYALVKETHTLSYSAASEPRSVVTDCLLGEPLFVLREAGDHLLVHSGEGYLGYVAKTDVYRVNAKKFSLYPTSKAVRILKNHQLADGLIVPAGAILKLLLSEDKGVVVALPTGETPTLPAEVCEIATPPIEKIEQAITVGKQLMETPYYWGGKTSSGIDCSGLVQVSFATCGVHLPRDSNQQFLLGRLAATRWYRRGLGRGDTMYFLGKNGRIRHTAIYLGGDRYLQAVTPKVNIRSLNPNHEDYDQKRAKQFAFAKRLWQ